MTSKSDLLQEIQLVLGAAINPRLSTRDEASDIYEAYLFALIVRAAELEGGQVDYRSVSGGKPTEFVFRKSPGYIHSIRQPYTYARIDFGAQSGPLETHLGVRVSGKSRVLHECDVLVLPEAEAIRCRSRGLAPRSHTLLLAVEAKFYASSLPLGEARGFVGLRTDFSAELSCLAANVQGQEASRLLDARAPYHEVELVPGSMAVDRFVPRVRSLFAAYKRS